MSSKRGRRDGKPSKEEAHITMGTITKSLFGSPGRPAMSAPALVTLAIAALVVLALSANAAQSAERHIGNNVALNGGKTWLKIDKGTAAALSDADVKVEATGAAVGPSAKRPYTFAFPIVGGKVDKDPLGGRIVHSGGLSFSADSKSVVVRRFVIDLDRGVLTAKVAGTGQRIALLRLGAPEGAKVDAKLTAQAANALNEAFDTDLFAGGLLIGEATVLAKIDDDKGEDNNDDKGEERNDD